MKALKIVGLVLLVLLTLVLFGGGFASELIGAYWPALGRQIADLLR